MQEDNSSISSSKSLTLQTLPFEIRLLIAKSSLESWKIFCLIFKDIGIHSLNKHIQETMKEIFIPSAFKRIQNNKFKESTTKKITDCQAVAMTKDNEGNIYVSAYGTIKVYDKNLKLVTSFQVKGTSWGISIEHSTQHLFISCNSENVIKEYDTKGNYIKSIGNLVENSGFQFDGTPGKLMNPRGIDVDSTNKHVFVCSRSCIEQYSTIDGKHIKSIQDKEGPLSPDSIALDRLGRIIVSDDHRCIVVLFSKDDGRKLFSLSSTTFNLPYGVVADKQCHIFVVDNGHRKVNIFDKEGNYLAHLDAEIQNPTSLMIDELNFLYVGDFNSESIRIF